MTTQSPEQIRLDIEKTRAELATDVDTLREKVSPSGIAHRRTQAVKGRLTAAKDKVMGSTGSATSSPSSTGSQLSEKASEAPTTMKQQTQGNPLAAGLIAFGAGWLISSLIPASQKEQQITLEAKDKASEHSDTLTAPLKEAAQGARDNLEGPARDAADSVRSSASDAAATVKSQTQSATQEVKNS
jgi:Protein of unknown function (DUF3618)